MDTVSEQSFEKALDKIRELSKQSATLKGENGLLIEYLRELEDYVNTIPSGMRKKWDELPENIRFAIFPQDALPADTKENEAICKASQ